jgi:predicted phosphodiesterase
VKLAFISDIHGNICGLIEVLKAIDQIAGVEKLVVGGDVLTASCGTNDLMELLTERQAEFIRGNIEEILCDLDGSLPKIPKRFHRYAIVWQRWLEQRVSAENWKLLAESPLCREYELDGMHRILACHATPTNSWERICGTDVTKDRLRSGYAACDAGIVVYGHYHEHHVIPLDGKLLVNVASVGTSMDGYSSFTIVESACGNPIVRQYTVPYDSEEEERLNRANDAPVYEELVGEPV